MTGNLGLQNLYLISGSPLNISTSIIDPLKGSLVIDTTAPALYLKTTQRGDNSGYRLITSSAQIAAYPYATSITPAITTGVDQVANMGTLTGALTLNAPTGTPTDGQKITFRWAENGIGGYAITRNAIYAFGTDVTDALVPTVASSKWEEVWEYNAADVKWRALGIARGF